MTLDPKNYTAVVAIVTANLPEGFTDRKRVLVTLHSMLPKSFEDRAMIHAAISAMNQSERLTASLSFPTQSSRKSGNGDGDGKKKGGVK